MLVFKEEENRHKYVLILAILMYTLVFSFSTIIKHRNFYSYAWDLGVFNQAMYNSVYENKLLHYTCDSYLNIKNNYLAFHFSPILGLLFPIYYLFPWVSTLLVIKSFLLAVAAYPLYLLGIKLTENKSLSLLVSLVYLIQPGLHGSNWFDFQPQVFIPLMLFSTFYFFLEKKWKFYIPTLLLSLFIEEHTFLIVGTILAGYYLVENTQIKDLLDYQNSQTRIVYATLGVSILVYILGSVVKLYFPVNSLYLDIFQTSKSFEVLEFKGSGFVLPFYALRYPFKALVALGHDLDLKFLYIIFLYGSLLFLPLLSIFSLPSMFLYLPFMLSNYRAYYTLGAHYYLYLVTSIFIGLLYTLKYLNNNHTKITRHVLTLSLFFVLLLSPLSPASQVLNRNQQVLWYPDQSRTVQEIDNLSQLVGYVPKNASVVTMNHIFPHVSGRVNAYVLPVLEANEEIERDLELYINELLESCDYVLLDLNVLGYWSEYAFENIVTSTEFGVWKTKGNSVLFKRGISDIVLPGDQAQIFTVAEIQFGSHEIISDPITNEPVARSVNGSKPGLFVYGPYTFLPEGNYVVSYRIKVENSESPLVGYYQITRELEEVVTRKNIWSYDFTDSDWHVVDIVVGLDRISMLTEFQLYSFGKADVYVSEISVTPLSVESIVSSTRSYYSDNLVVPNGDVTDEMIIRSINETMNELWYGPYSIIEPGSYVLDFNLRARPLGDSFSNDVIKLDVISSKNLSMIAEFNVTALDMEGGDWKKIVLRFTVNEPMKLEFRGMYPSNDWLIELSDITLNPILPETIVQYDVA